MELKAMRTKSANKIAIVSFIICFVVLFKVLNVGQYLTLSYIKSSQETFRILYARHQVVVVAGYMVIYIFVTSLSLPGAAVMTIAGGALFGFWLGSLVVSFSSSLGATLSCVLARFLLRDWVAAKFGERLLTVNRGIQKEGSFYLFTLRLIPIFPFFVINLIMGLTEMPLFTFYWVSQLGMLPGTMVYVNAGKELAKIESLSGILSPGLIVSLVLLGLFPIATKKILTLNKSKKRKTAQRDPK